MLLFFCIPVFGQNTFTIKGTAFDEMGQVVSGASVFLKNEPGVGTATNEEGKFSIKVSKGDKIVFSFISYNNVEYIVEGPVNDLKIVFKDAKKLNEVIVTGLGSQRKISVVGAISTLEASQLQVPATSIANIIGGRMPGVITMQTSGEPGKNISEFWIRGIGTFGANSSALVLIDGLEGNLNSVDPADIQSFSILKDASATAVYGVRGANGVVLITTKRGESGKLKINARANFTISKLNNMPDYLGAYDYAKLANEARVVRNEEPLYSSTEMNIIKYGLDKDLYPDVNWQKEIVNPTSFKKTYYVSAQGGGEIARYFLSLGMSDESAAYNMDKDSPYKADPGYKTYTYRNNLDINLTKTTKLYFGIDGYLTRRKQPGITSTDDLWAAQSELTPLTIPTKYSTGQLPAFGTGSLISPYVMLNYTGTASDEDNFLKATLAVNQDLSFFIKGLKFKAQGAFDNNTYYSERRYILPELYYASSRDVDGQLQVIKKVDKVAATYSNAQNQYRKYHFEMTLNYDKKWNDVNNFTGLVYYYMSDSKATRDIYNSGITASMAAIPKRYQGISSRLTYSYNDIYLSDLNFGYTGSENFQAGHRFGFFPSIALGWVPTNYESMKHITWLDFFKIRGSYGTVGNDQISETRFPYLTLVNENASAGWGGTTGITESTIGANNLR
jgi:Outer membrane cobalamin receptor protein